MYTSAIFARYECTRRCKVVSLTWCLYRPLKLGLSRVREVCIKTALRSIPSERERGKEDRESERELWKRIISADRDLAAAMDKRRRWISRRICKVFLRPWRLQPTKPPRWWKRERESEWVRVQAHSLRRTCVFISILYDWTHWSCICGFSHNLQVLMRPSYKCGEFKSGTEIQRRFLQHDVFGSTAARFQRSFSRVHFGGGQSFFFCNLITDTTQFVLLTKQSS